MTLEEILSKFSGKEVTNASSYESWAMQYFHDKEIVQNPYLNMTLDIDLTEARQVYDTNYKAHQGASFQAYITWNLLKALQDTWVFNTRKIEGRWYRFSNLPVFMPIAIGGDLRFKDAILYNTQGIDWPSFVSKYRQSIDNGINKLEILPQNIWALCIFIGNLPNMTFKSFSLHHNKMNTGRPFFYFGQRRLERGRLMVPASITFDHANSDPLVLDQLLKSFSTHLTDNTGTNLKLSA